MEREETHERSSEVFLRGSRTSGGAPRRPRSRLRRRRRETAEPAAPAEPAEPPAEPAEPPAEPAEPPAEYGSCRQPAADLSGSIEVDGSSTVGPLVQAAAEFFQEENSGVNVTVGVSGTGGGFERFCAGETDISNASRPISEDDGGTALRRGRRRVRRAPGGGRRAHGRNEHGERLGDLSHGRAAQHHVGARGRGNGDELEPGRPELPRPGAGARPGPAPTPGRSTTSPTSSTARRARAAPTTTPARTTTSSSRRSRASRAGSATSDTPTTSRTRTP